MELKQTPISVTQCLKGTMESFLKIVTPYYVSPQSLAFSLDGTDMHAILEKYAVAGEIAEQRVRDLDLNGQPDLLEPNEELNDGSLILYDYKKFGSYHAAKLLAKYIITEPVVGHDGLPVEITRGKNKGQFKMIKRVDMSKQPLYLEPMCDVSLQMNKYRRLFEESGGGAISRMTCQITLRDGGVESARKYGLHDKIYMVDAPFLSNDFVDNFFSGRAKSLMAALKAGKCHEICTVDERWEDRKCLGFCPVAHACPHGKVIIGMGSDCENSDDSASDNAS